MAIPIVTGINPTLESDSGGTTVTVFGKNFTGATNLTFGVIGNAFNIVSDEKINTTSPAGTGSVYVTVTNLNGTSSTTPNNQFTYIASPNISTESPTMGSSNGGTVVTLIGSNFTGTSAVSFGATPAATFTVQSDTQILATSPPGVGTVSINVTNPNGSSSIGGFIYTTPAIINSLSSTSGPAGGGNSITIIGVGLTTVTNVTFGSTSAIFTINSDTQITATVPSETGQVLVSVVNAVSTSNTLGYNYIDQPTISAINPISAPTAGGGYVNITGTNLNSTTQINFDSSIASTFYIISDTQLSVIVPPGNGNVNVNVTNIGGTSNNLSFDYINQPGI